MFGKHFASMYEGSMVGSGAHVFAIMGYVIANTRPDPTVGSQVRLNPKLLSAIFGETEVRIQEAIDFLCAPDPKSTTPDENGRRLLKIGQFDYRVVNGAKYFAIRSEEERREANRARVAKHRETSRERPKKRSKPIKGEALHQRATDRGESESYTDKLSDPEFLSEETGSYRTGQPQRNPSEPKAGTIKEPPTPYRTGQV